MKSEINQPSARLPTGLTVLAFWLIVFRDFLRAVEHVAGVSVSLNLVGLFIVTVATLANFARRSRSRNAPFFIFVVGVLILHFALLFFRNLESASDLRALVGLYYVHGAIPLFVVSAALRYDLRAFLESRGTMRLLFAVVLFGIAQVVYAALEPAGFGNFLMSLYRESIIAYPVQTVVSGGFQIRTMSVFYSAFAFSLVLNWLVAYLLFVKPLRWRYLFAVMVLIGLQYTTFNRNGLFMLGYILALRILMPLLTKRLVAITAAVVAAALIFLGPVLLATFDTGAGGDSSFLLKTSTLQSRVYSWTIISEAPFTEWLLGTGFVQGLSQSSTTEFFIDNFFIYLTWQNGLVIALSLSWALILMLVTLVPGKGGDRYSLFVFVVFSAGLLGFSLNIMFFEPLFQLFYFAPAVALICKPRATGEADAQSQMPPKRFSSGSLQRA